MIAQIVLEMLTDREYSLTNEIKNEIIQVLNGSNYTTHYLPIDENQKKFLCVTSISKFGVDETKLLIGKLERTNAKELILILSETITSFASKMLIEYTASKACKLWIFTEQQLRFNVTKHRLVPKHKKLTKIEKEKILTKNKLQIGQIPKLLNSDPIAKYYGFDTGDLIQIKRDIGSDELFFRIVI